MARRGTGSSAIRIRSVLRTGDDDKVEALARATAFFSEEEVRIARELVEDGLSRGAASDYRFLMADANASLAGYACFGRVPCTQSTWDLYWIAVSPDWQGQGLGRPLVGQLETDIRRAGGSRIYADTSSRTQYAPTRAFYIRCGYREAAQFPDFYSRDDGKIVFLKILGPGGHQALSDGNT